MHHAILTSLSKLYVCECVCVLCVCVCSRYEVNVIVRVCVFELNCVTMLRFYVDVGGEMSNNGCAPDCGRYERETGQGNQQKKV